MDKHYYPRCERETSFKYYDGCLGYESFVCICCGMDINDIIVSNDKLNLREVKNGSKNNKTKSFES
jgi:hypothetical protein